MADTGTLKILAKGVLTWNQWRRDRPGGTPDLSGADLEGETLFVAVPEYKIHEPEVTRVVRLIGADLTGTNLTKANLSQAHLFEGDFSYADLTDANLSGAFLDHVNFTATILKRTNFDQAHLGLSTFGNVDLSQTIGLDRVIHQQPSIIGIHCTGLLGRFEKFSCVAVAYRTTSLRISHRS